MQAVHAALAVFGVFVSSALLFSPLSSMGSPWAEPLGAGDALIAAFGVASAAVGAMAAYARHRIGGPACTTLNL